MTEKKTRGEKEIHNITRQEKKSQWQPMPFSFTMPQAWGQVHPATRFPGSDS
jgi:hypothetical protein